MEVLNLLNYLNYSKNSSKPQQEGLGHATTDRLSPQTMAAAEPS